MASTLGSDFLDEPDAEAEIAAGSGAERVLSASPQIGLYILTGYAWGP